MNHLIVAPLFFGLVALLSWMFFSWEGDKRDGFMAREITRLEKELNDALEKKRMLAMILYNTAYSKNKGAQIMHELWKRPEVAAYVNSIFEEASKQQEKGA